MYKIKYIVTLLVSLLFLSCGSHKKTVKTTRQPQVEESIIEHEEEADVPKEVVVEVQEIPKNNMPVKTVHPKAVSYTKAKENYILKYKDIAMQEMRDYQIPASITLAQGILESSAGRSELSAKSNNHFGIKCHTAWQGERVYHDDDAKGECFRKYKDPTYSFKDHSAFLSGRKRYANLFKLARTDYRGWAKGLRKAGYATDKRYPQKLIALIEEFKLYKYDAQVLGKSYQEPVKETMVFKSHTVVKGDTLYSISKMYGVSVSKLKQINALQNNIISIGQQLKIQ